MGLHPLRTINQVWLILFLGTALRIYTAVRYNHLLFPDEHFQTLEPASGVVFGFGWKSWEWYHGVRSWFIPGLYMPLMFILKSFGINGGPISITLCRVLTALCSTISLLSFHKLLDQRKLRSDVSLIILSCMAFFSPLIVWHASTLSETWASCFFWISLPLILEGSAWGGLLLGLSVVARIQMIPMGLGILWSLSIFKRCPRKVYFGFFLAFIFLGALDTLTWGLPFFSIYKNVTMNLFEGVADLNGRSPWHAYFSLIRANWGTVPLLLLAFSILGALVTSRYKDFSIRKINLIDVAIFISSSLFFMAHALIGHKETRFIVPLYFSIFYVFALALNRFSKKAAVFIIAALLVSRTGINDASFDPSDLSDLSETIAKDVEFKSEANPCLIFVNHYWIWTRGEMLFGRPIKFDHYQLEELTPEHLTRCRFLIAASNASATFEQRYGPRGWRRISDNVYGHSYFKKQRADAP